MSTTSRTASRTTSKVRTHTRTTATGRKVKVRSHRRANRSLARRGISNIGRAWKAGTKKQKGAMAGFLSLGILEIVAWITLNATGWLLGALAALLLAICVGAVAYANGGDQA